MKNALVVVLLLVLAGLGLMFGAQAYDRSRHAAQVRDDMQAFLSSRTLRLDADLQALLAQTQRLADTLADKPGKEVETYLPLAAQIYRAHESIQSVTYVHQFKIARVYPVLGNENVMGMDYTLHPEFMGRIQQMIRMRSPIVDGAQKLVQTGRPGLIFRAPIFIQTKRSGLSYQGMAVITADLSNMLHTAGLQSQEDSFDLAIRSSVDGQPAQTLFGEPGLFQAPEATSAIALPGERWELAAVARTGQAYDESRTWVIRAVVAVMMLLTLLWLYRRGLLRMGPLWGVRADGLISLHTLLLLVTLLPIPLLVGLAGWLMYSTALQTLENLEEQRVVELSNQLHGQVVDFFEVPRRVISYNVGRMVGGLVDLDQHDQLQHSFLLQMRQQPLLTHLSVGWINGDYLSASRPPLGSEKGLRILEAEQSDGGRMRIYRVDDANRRSPPAILGNPHFDARLRPWFTTAIMVDGLGWYSAYRYMIKDPEGRFDDMGMGMSVPLEDDNGQLLGVLTADVALSQISHFLKNEMLSLKGVAFLIDDKGKLLATSELSPIYQEGVGWTRQLDAEESDSDPIRLVGGLIRRSEQALGKHFIDVGNKRYLTRWQSIQLPNGPLLTLALALPEDHFAVPAAQAYQRFGVLILGFSLLGMVLASFAALWLARPLLSLSKWAEQLAQGDWPAHPQVQSPVREVVTLARSLHRMAGTLQGHTAELEKQVAQRTQELVQANQRLLGLSTTDSLTGLANRRHFDEFLEREWRRAKRERFPICLLMLDVDWFKLYNDRYGHPAGDNILSQVGQVLRNSANRPGDLVARYGGEEFAVILAGMNCREAHLLAERMRLCIMGLALTHADGLGGRLTVSIGVAEMNLDDEFATEALVRQADAALYRAKAAGRNRVDSACMPEDGQA